VITTDAIRVRGWEAVLLYPRSKAPAVKKYESVKPTNDLDAIRHHVEAGGNLALRTHEDVNLVILDADDLGGWDSMVAALGAPGRPWVETGRARQHYYTTWAPHLPGTIMWRGQRIRECFRGPGVQQVVCPPSTHPITRRPYRWLVDPVTEPLRPLPESWRAALRSARTRRSSSTSSASTTSSALSLSELEDAALQRPGARRRHDKIKFQCPQCASDGHDVSEDNAVLFLENGNWGCAYTSGELTGRRHWLAIGVALGALSAEFVRPAWSRKETP
jgi:hypothetical protein